MLLNLLTQEYILSKIKKYLAMAYSFLPQQAVQYTEPMNTEDTKNIVNISRSKSAISEVLCVTDKTSMHIYKDISRWSQDEHNT